MYEDRATLNTSELADYLQIGTTKARELIRDKSLGFGYQIGNRWYANKARLDKWIISRCK